MQNTCDKLFRRELFPTHTLQPYWHTISLTLSDMSNAASHPGVGQITPAFCSTNSSVPNRLYNSYCSRDRRIDMDED